MLNVLDWLHKRSPTGRKAAKIYGSIVTQARSPALYASYGVPDTPNGRYEMIVVHMALALTAMKALESDPKDKLGRSLVEHFVTDMDDSLRQLAVGDLSVSKKVRRAAAGLRERCAEYGAAWGAANPRESLQKALAANVFENQSGNPDAGGAERLAAYVLRTHAALTVTPDGRLHGFIDPEVVRKPAEADRNTSGATP